QGPRRRRHASPLDRKQQHKGRGKQQSYRHRSSPDRRSQCPQPVPPRYRPVRCRHRRWLYRWWLQRWWLHRWWLHRWWLHRWWLHRWWRLRRHRCLHRRSRRQRQGVDRTLGDFQRAVDAPERVLGRRLLAVRDAPHLRDHIVAQLVHVERTVAVSVRLPCPQTSYDRVREDRRLRQLVGQRTADEGVLDRVRGGQNHATGTLCHATDADPSGAPGGEVAEDS